MSRLAMLMAATAMLVATIAIAPAGAQLTAVEYGFPSVFQNAVSTVFSKDILSATNFENVNINFGAAGLAGLACGGLPSISQVSEKTYYAEHMDYAHTEETAAFNYPFASIGGLGGLPFGLC